MMPFWCALDGLADQHEQLEPPPGGELALVAELGEGHTFDQFHDEERPAALGGAGVEHAGDVGVVHQGQRLTLRLEARQDGFGVHPRLDDLDRDGALDRLGLLGHPDGAHAAGADLLDQLVLAREHRAGAGGRVTMIFRPRLALRDVRARTVCRLGRGRRGGGVGPQQRLDACAEFGVAAALALQVSRTFCRIGEVRRGKEQGFRPGGIDDGHVSPRSWVLYPQCPIRSKSVSPIPTYFSRASRSQARAYFQFR
jgi:hypothetical protein